jgi:hypothetical protein
MDDSDMKMDNSSVFHVSMLDEAHRKQFPPDKPWLFQIDDDLICCATEDEACGVQRTYREAMGFDPITGEKQ